MNFSYKLDHDYGLAPNPFWGYCTLGVCKSQIRNNRNLQIGSWIFGLGSRKLNRENHLIYAMQVEEKLTFQEYWVDERFQSKKPKEYGTLKMLYGDNIYSQENGIWKQLNSAHSLQNAPNVAHMNRDISGTFVLVSKNFFYFGEKAIPIKEEYSTGVICNGRNFCSPNLEESVTQNFVGWLNDNYVAGKLYGDPINWKLDHY